MEISSCLEIEGLRGIGRRSLLFGVGAVSLCGVTPVMAQGEIAGPEGLSAGEFWSRPRSVWLRRSKSAEEVRATYWADGGVVLAGYQQLCVFLRDTGFERAIRSGDARVMRAVQKGVLPQQISVAVPVSLRMLDGLYALGGWLEHFGMARPIHVNSAYRHPFYNNHMVEGAKRDGYHTKGRASDIQIEGVSPQRISQFGAWLGVGGIGLYVSKGFTHMDDGAQRFWRGK